MKISYSVAILLSCTLAQLVSASGATHEDLEGFKHPFIDHKLVEKRNVNNRYLATALRRRQTNTLSPVTAPPATAVTSSPSTQAHSILANISDSIKQTLASSDDSSDDQGQEETKDREDKLEEKQRKELIKLVKKLVKAINELLKTAGLETEALDLDGVFKSAEKGRLAAPTSSKAPLEARGLGGLFKSPANLDRNLMAPAPPAAAPAPADSENDGGDDGSTEGDKQHHKNHPKKPEPPAQANTATPGAPAAPAAPAAPKAKNSDGGTEGDDEHHQSHPNPAKKRSTDEKPDPKEIKSAANKVNNALEELNGAGQALEDENAPGLTQLVTLVQQLIALFN